MKDIHLYCDNTLKLYHKWESPTVIISDGAYGVGGFDGDLSSYKGLDSWYEPHIREWSKKATNLTTLWFWNTEVGWATVHPILEKYGWKYVSCNIWNKGIKHIAGNCNTKTIRHFPVVTEVCVQYIREPIYLADGVTTTIQEWLISEWKRTGFPLSKTNEVCGVKNAATRKYFTKDNNWYFPPEDMFLKLVEYANLYGNEEGKPYFCVNKNIPFNPKDIILLRSKFKCPFGVTNVWDVPPLRGAERIKVCHKSLHPNQKPLELIQRLIEVSSDKGDVVWDPFGGLFTTALAAKRLERICYSSEMNKDMYEIAYNRIMED